MAGIKHDKDKARWDLVPWDGLERVVDVLTFGAKKYGDRNWENGLEWSRVFAACIRHLWKWFHGEPHDKETGISHLGHAGCCILFLLAYEVRRSGSDDRPNVLAINDSAQLSINDNKAPNYEEFFKGPRYPAFGKAYTQAKNPKPDNKQGPNKDNIGQG